MSRHRATRNASLSSILPALPAAALTCALLFATFAPAQAARPVRRQPAPAQRPAQRPIQQQRPAHQPQAQSRPESAAPYAAAHAPGTPAPIVRSTPQNATPQGSPAPSAPPQSVMQKPAGGTSLITPNRPGQTQQHLANWIDQHRNMPLADQQRALQNEPGFRSLPQQEQTQLQNRLRQLNNMPEAQRQQTIAHTEAMERLQPQQRQQVRAAMSQLGSLSEDRRAAVARGFHQALALPAPQRQAWLNSPQARGQFNDNERDTINHLLTVQPAAAQAGFAWAKPPAPHE